MTSDGMTLCDDLNVDEVRKSLCGGRGVEEVLLDENPKIIVR